MRFRFHAIDDSGRPVSSVLEADSDEHARALLIENALFPKRIEPVGDDTPLGWAPRRRDAGWIAPGVRATDAAPKAELTNTMSKVATILHRDGASHAGTLGVGPDSVVVFVAESADGPRIALRASDVEAARINGFPLRVFRIFLLDGGLCEIPAGFLFAGRVQRAACDALTTGLPKDKRKA